MNAFNEVWMTAVIVFFCVLNYFWNVTNFFIGDFARWLGTLIFTFPSNLNETVGLIWKTAFFITVHWLIFLFLLHKRPFGEYGSIRIVSCWKQKGGGGGLWRKRTDQEMYTCTGVVKNSGHRKYLKTTWRVEIWESECPLSLVRHTYAKKGWKKAQVFAPLS